MSSPYFTLQKLPSRALLAKRQTPTRPAPLQNPLPQPQSLLPETSDLVEFDNDKDNALLAEIVNDMASKGVTAARSNDPNSMNTSGIDRPVSSRTHISSIRPSTPKTAKNSARSRELTLAPIVPKLTARHSPAASGSAPTDAELLRAAMERVTQLERLCSAQREEVGERDKRIRMLEDKMAILKHAKEAATKENPGSLKLLESKCMQFQKQIYEMEKFLADYGLIWVGEGAEDAADNADAATDTAADSWIPGQSVAASGEQPSSAPSNAIDFDRVLANVRDLNQLAGEGTAHVERTKSGHGAQLKLQESLTLALYANGLLLGAGPFRPYTDPECTQLVRDLLDGYFPSELQQRYPNGIPLAVTDKRGVQYVYERWQKLLEREYSPQEEAPEENPTTLPADQSNGPKMTVAQFLNKLPSQVVRGGKLVEIRDSVAKVLQGTEKAKPVKEIVIETDVSRKPASGRLSSTSGATASKSAAAPPSAPAIDPPTQRPQTQNLMPDAKSSSAKRPERSASNTSNASKAPPTPTPPAGVAGAVGAAVGEAFGASVGSNPPTPDSVTLSSGAKQPLKTPTVAATPNANANARQTPSRTTAAGSEGRVTTLRVRSESGDQVYVVQMHYEDSVQRLKFYLDSKVAGRESLRDSYVIVALATDPVSRRPTRTELLDEDQTMEKLGLVPNALLHLKRKKITR